jgi:hypothetical protein
METFPAIRRGLVALRRRLRGPDDRPGLKETVFPLIERENRVGKDRTQRAIAGLPMGS